MQHECGSCQFWLQIPSEKGNPLGQCRRYPPVVMVVGAQPPALAGQPARPLLDALYPVMAPVSWCGEFQQAVAVNGKPMPIDLTKLDPETLN